ISSASAMLGGASSSVGQLSEWAVGTVDQGNWCWNSNQVASVTCTTPPTTHALDLALGCFSELLGSNGAVTLSPGSGWTSLGDNNASSTKLHYYFNYALGLSSGASVAETVTSGSAGTWGGIVLTFY